MQELLTLRKLKLNKKTISTLNNHRIVSSTSIVFTECRPTEYCTDPECASVAGGQCRTDHYQSCAPCYPTKGDPPPPYTKGC
jgi:hypothetical protein